MLKLTLINSRLKIPATNYVVQCNTLPNNNIILLQICTCISGYDTLLKMTRNSSRARQLLSRVDLTGFTMLTLV